MVYTNIIRNNEITKKNERAEAGSSAAEAVQKYKQTHAMEKGKTKVSMCCVIVLKKSRLFSNRLYTQTYNIIKCISARECSMHLI